MLLLGNKVLVERVKRATATTKTGILLPESALDDFNTGGPKEYLVLAVGPGRRNRKGVLTCVEFSPGDRVICHSYTTGAHELPDGRMVITDDMVMAVIPMQK
jgi:chaperonin GroES